MSAGDAMIRYNAATVGYGPHAVVSSASLEVRAGEIVGLVGPNGAGKSTLLRAVTGDATLLGGEIEVAGRSLAGLSAMERAALVGVVPQSINVTFSFPAEEFVEMGRHPHLPRFGGPGPADREAVERAMHLTDTARLAGRPVDALSGGDVQRLSFAQALATQPRVLLLDEPVSHLDLNHRLQVLDLTRDLADNGMAVLAVFHDLDLAARYADRIAVVAEGALRPAGPPSSVITAPMLREVFGVRAVVVTDPITGSVTVTPVLRDGAVVGEHQGRVHVVGGSGVAAHLIRKLVLAGYTVTAGALNTGDADATLAQALDVEFALIPPFAPMDSDAAIATAKLAEKADAIVVCEVPFGHGNVDNLLIAAHANKPLVLVGEIEGRDYTGGAATSYWSEALAANAQQVTDTTQVREALDRVMRTSASDA